MQLFAKLKHKDTITSKRISYLTLTYRPSNCLSLSHKLDNVSMNVASPGNSVTSTSNKMF